MEIYKEDCKYYKHQLVPGWFGLDKQKHISCNSNKMICGNLPLPYDPEQEHCPQNCEDYKHRDEINKEGQLKILNTYAQEAWHTDAKIIGNYEGLWELHGALEDAIKKGIGKTVNLFASDGEGYEIIIECHNDKWGGEHSPNNYWNKKESQPQYLILERGTNER